jgi:prepilin-type N-terminal cleavage/methylation domain-containing protein
MVSPDAFIQHRVKRLKTGAAFTLVELLVTIAVISVLAGLLLSALSTSKARALRTMCVSNMRQWGIAIQMYGGDHNESFPDNRDASGLVYCGTNVQKFWNRYLLPWAKTKDQKARNHILFCPTDRFHRGYDMQDDLSEATQVFCGYFLLPNRDLDYSRASMDWEIGGVADWHSRPKLGGEFYSAPVLVDRVQASGRSAVGGSTVLRWQFGEGLSAMPLANHARGRLSEPVGGNFLFEDGRVSWFKKDSITLASKVKGPKGEFNYIFFL